MNLVPDIAAIVDREWDGANPPPSSRGFVERVCFVPTRFIQSYRGPIHVASEAFWTVQIGGHVWGIRPKDAFERHVLEAFSRL